MQNTHNTRKGAQGFQRTHGMRDAPEYRIWNHMKLRCHSPTNRGYYKYGAKGVTVCQRWRDSFEAFYADVGPRPSPWHSIDRIDPTGNYEPGNVRWALPVTQANNKRTTICLTVDGVTKPLMEWSADTGIAPMTLRHRYHKGWTHDAIVKTPLLAVRDSMDEVRRRRGLQA